MIRRREFIAGLGSAAAWPAVARAQQGDRVRIGVLMAMDNNDPEGKLRYSAFTQALTDMGWTDGRNVRMDLRWGGADINRIRVKPIDDATLRLRFPKNCAKPRPRYR